MRCLFVVLTDAGHLYPMIAVAQHLVRDGHDVGFFSIEDIAPRLAAAGLPARSTFVTTAPEKRPARGRELAELLAQPAFARRWYRYALLSQVPPQLAALRELVRTERPDVIATDPFAYAGAIVAEQAGIPWASISTQLLALAPPELRFPYIDLLEEPALVAERGALLAAERVELSFALAEVVSPQLFTVFATDALAVAGRRVAHARCVGPAAPPGRRGDEPEFPWQRLRAGVPLVYVSFGTQLAPAPATYAAVAGALNPHEADIVVAGEPPELAPHVTAVRWAPQLALLERARVLVTHGGANSVAECLTRGVPPLVIPLGFDQPLQAELVVRAGAGRALDPSQVTGDAARAALEALLANGPERRRAAELAHSYAAADGAAQVAALISLMQ